MKNIGGLDRVFRIVLGLALLAVPFVMVKPDDAIVAFGTYGWLMVAAGVVMLVTAVFRFCPMYRVLGIRTCSTRM
ncbi:YgaP family membrane protein [Thalassospira lohafexi]|uniref:Inner membrane protein YgaP-like transmembrane domain-containing protein n=1 Tax=Thalassospira lohafexi TaxID=744227 RepID=A0A2N3LA64_9PROT|nr:DUF2892 domain-containing protein [Thalassospira lohafexi]PKR59682.1 hypothetical protein COO92_06590 [Thalassospira lohafexi]